MKAVMNLKWPDMLLWYEKSYDETVVKWLREGLPADKIVVIDRKSELEESHCSTGQSLKASTPTPTLDAIAVAVYLFRLTLAPY